jgi:hypothetical protein
MALIQLGDLMPFADIPSPKALAMIEDAEAMAILAAPCLAALPIVPVPETAEALALRTAKIAGTKAILRGAILRWNEAGTGALSAESAGPWGQTLDTRVPRKAMFWPSEIEQLQSICSTGDVGKAFTVDTVSASSIHAPWCSLAFGALYCSCGADIAGFPLYGGE